MTCRSYRLSSALVTFARDMTGLADNQVLALSHALMREGGSTPLDPNAWETLITRTEEQYRTGELRINPGSSDPTSRLEAARGEIPDAGRVYAAERLLRRAQLAVEANREYMENFARETGRTVQQVGRDFAQNFTAATDDRRTRATNSFVRAWRANPDNANLFVDGRSLYAYQQMEQTRTASLARASASASPVSRPAVTRRPVHGSYMSEMGYDPETGRLEIQFSSNGRVYAYRLPQEEFDAFENAPSLGSYFSNHIRGNANFAYRDEAEAAEAATVVQCATCGRFAGRSNHSCPVPGSPASIAADLNVAINAEINAALLAANPPAQTPLVAVAPVAAAVVPAPAVAVNRFQVQSSRMTRYDIPGGAVRIPGITRLRTEARQNQDIRLRVNGYTYPGHNYVSGNADISYDPATRQYLVSYQEANGAPNGHLRCSCDTYRQTYRCEHLDVITSGISARMNGTIVTAAQGRAAATPVTTQLNNLYVSSVAATAASTAAFKPLSESFVDNPELLQGAYEESRAEVAAFRAAVARGEAAQTPVPYLTENVFGGLAKRGSGRGFGIEIEYGFPAGMGATARSEAKRVIGQELYAAGITRREYQEGYGASHTWARDHQLAGWSYEDDPTTGGVDGQNGGEVTSPISYDEEDTWTNLKKITEIIKRNGGVTTKGSSMHVHVSVPDYDHRVEIHNRLLNSFAEHADLVYRLASNPFRGKHRKGRWCEPNPNPGTTYSDIGDVRAQNGHHGLGLNFQSVTGRDSDHIEVRTADSTLDPGVMQAQIGMALYMAQGATRPNTTPSQAGLAPVGTRYQANRSRTALSGDAWAASTLGFRTFLDRFVPGGNGPESENPQVRQLISLFAFTKWQSPYSEQ